VREEESMIKTDEWTERQASTQRQLMRARVRRAALDEYYKQLVSARASNGVDAVELLVSGEAAEEMAALEEELDDARHDLEAADARSKLLTQLLGRRDQDEAAGFNPQSEGEDNPRVRL